MSYEIEKQPIQSISPESNEVNYSFPPSPDNNGVQTSVSTNTEATAVVQNPNYYMSTSNNRHQSFVSPNDEGDSHKTSSFRLMREESERKLAERRN
jgi:hypothetical protein